MVFLLLPLHVLDLSSELALLEVIEEQLAHFGHRNSVVQELVSLAEVAFMLLFLLLFEEWSLFDSLFVQVQLIFISFRSSLLLGLL